MECTGNSWIMINNYTVIKKVDESFIEHHGTCLGGNVKDFFKDGEILIRDNVSIILNARKFEAGITKHKNNMERLFWKRDLMDEIKELSLNIGNAYCVFNKINNNTYEMIILN